MTDVEIKSRPEGGATPPLKLILSWPCAAATTRRLHLTVPLHGHLVGDIRSLYKGAVLQGKRGDYSASKQPWTGKAGLRRTQPRGQALETPKKPLFDRFYLLFTRIELTRGVVENENKAEFCFWGSQINLIPCARGASRCDGRQKNIRVGKEHVSCCSFPPLGGEGSFHCPVHTPCHLPPIKKSRSLAVASSSFPRCRSLACAIIGPPRSEEALLRLGLLAALGAASTPRGPGIIFVHPWGDCYRRCNS